MKSELQKLVPKSERAASPAAPPETPSKDAPPASAEDRPALPGKDAGVPAAQAPAGPALGHPRAVSDGRSAETEEGLAPLQPSTPPGTEAEGAAMRGGCAPALLMDSSVFLDDDSSQPMPVGRFFGNVELMQVRLPGAPSPHTCAGCTWGPRRPEPRVPTACPSGGSIAPPPCGTCSQPRPRHGPGLGARRVCRPHCGVLTACGALTPRLVREQPRRSRASAPVSPAMRVCPRCRLGGRAVPHTGGGAAEARASALGPRDKPVLSPKDLPPASSSCPSVSRREFRKMHFRAKEEEEEEEDAET